ncbi:unnamed protein product [Prorocentrum cordatum]|uniref:Uncharacterized protein n=1 Tax=Prorocentrum cordatum TaxID=2364126 RepID=A0ABN9XC51_9DINO|nr:unnamed protein product [Polarella glacialis]
MKAQEPGTEFRAMLPLSGHACVTASTPSILSPHGSGAQTPGTHSKASTDATEEQDQSAGTPRSKTLEELRAKQAHCIRALRTSAAQVAAASVFANLPGPGPPLSKSASLPLLAELPFADSDVDFAPAPPCTARGPPTSHSGMQELMLEAASAARYDTRDQMSEVRRAVRAQARELEALRRQQDPLARAVSGLTAEGATAGLAAEAGRIRGTAGPLLKESPARARNIRKARGAARRAGLGEPELGGPLRTGAAAVHGGPAQLPGSTAEEAEFEGTVVQFAEAAEFILRPAGAVGAPAAVPFDAAHGARGAIAQGDPEGEEERLDSLAALRAEVRGQQKAMADQQTEAAELRRCVEEALAGLRAEVQRLGQESEAQQRELDRVAEMGHGLVSGANACAEAAAAAPARRMPEDEQASPARRRQDHSLESVQPQVQYEVGDLAGLEQELWPRLQEMHQDCQDRHDHAARLVSDLESRMTEEWTGLRGWVEAATVAVVNRISALECTLRTEMSEHSERVQQAGRAQDVAATSAIRVAPRRSHGEWDHAGMQRGATRQHKLASVAVLAQVFRSIELCPGLSRAAQWGRASRHHRLFVMVPWASSIRALRCDSPRPSEELLRSGYAGSVARPASSQGVLASVDTIARAKEWVAADGFYHPVRPELMSEDFVWEGPVVGPLNKVDLIGTVGTFKVYEAFPDLKQECFGWGVDPRNELKAWCFMRVQGTHTADLNAGAKIPATSKELRQNVQAISVTLNSEGQVERYTGGYVVDNRPEEGNTGGLGGFFGVLEAIGECRLQRQVERSLVS